MKILELLAKFCSVLSGVLLTFITLMTCYSLIGRNTTGDTIVGDFELTGVATGAAIALFMPLCQLKHENIIVDFFTTNASEQTQSKLDAFGTLLYTLVMGLVAWRVAVGGIDIKANQETSMLMALPLWIPYMLMVPGLVLCTVIGFVQTLQHLGLIAKENV